MEKRVLNLPNSEIVYFPNFFIEEDSTKLFNELKEEIDWKKEKVKVFGKEYWQPRLTAFYSEIKTNYSYSNLTLNASPFFARLSNIKNKIEQISGHDFNSCLANLYRDGKDSNGWHADDEKELGKNPSIASVSFGQERVFKFRSKENHRLQHKMILEHGSLLLMLGETQHYWQHQLPKTSRTIDERINLTFRKF